MGRPRTPQQSKKTPIAKKAHTRTAGEALFEMYLHQNGYLDYDFEPEISGSKQKPDYRLRTGFSDGIVQSLIISAMNSRSRLK